MSLVLRKLVLHNFKSYRGTHEIGPFNDFTAIIGPNGSGKSNILDAISFTFTLNSSYLRCNNLVELIHNPTALDESQDFFEEIRSCSVEAELFNNDTKVATMLSRTLRHNGNSTYAVDGKRHSKKEYVDILESMAIFPTINNFIVFQGQVSTVSHFDPTQLTEIFEKVSGSGQLKEEYDSLMAEQEAFTIETLNYRREFKDIEQEARYYKEMEAKNREIANIKAEIADTVLTKAVFSLAFYKNVIDSAKGELEKARYDLEVANQSQLDFSMEMKDLSISVETLAKKTTKSAGEIKSLKRMRHRTERELQRSKQTVGTVELSIKSLNREMEQLASGKNTAELEVASLEELIAAVETDIAELKDQYNEKVGSASAIFQDEALLNQFDELCQEANILSLEKRRELERNDAVLRSLRQSLIQTRGSLSAFNEKKYRGAIKRDSILKEMATKRTKLTTAHEELRAADSAVNNRTNTVAELISERNRLEYHKDSINQEISSQKISKSEFNRRRKRVQTLGILKRVFSGVRGVLTDLITPVSEEYQLAIQVALGRHVSSVVVDTIDTALACAAHLRLKRLPPMTFLPIESIEDFEASHHLFHLTKSLELMNEDDMASAFDGCVLAHECLECEEGVEKVVRFALKDCMICPDMRTARVVAYARPPDVANIFKGLGIPNKVRTVTVDGRMIQKSGVLSVGLGSFAASNSFDEERLVNLMNDLTGVEADIVSVRERISRVPDESEAADVQRRCVVNVASIEGEIQMLSDKCERENAALERFDSEVQRLTDQMQHCESEISAKEDDRVSLLQEIEGIEEAVFGQLSQTDVDLVEIRRVQLSREEIESEYKTEMAQLNEKRAQHAQRLQFARSALLNADVAERFARRLSKRQSRLRQANSDLVTYTAELRELDAKLLDESKIYKSSKQRYRQALQSLDSFKLHVTQNITRMSTLQHGVCEYEAVILDSRLRCSSILRKMEIPNTSEGFVRLRDDVEDEALDRLLETVDFDDLPRDLVKLSNVGFARSGRFKEKVSQLSEKIHQLETKLSGMNAIFDIDVKVDEVSARYKEAKRVNTAKRKRLKTIRSNLRRVREARRKHFMDLFEHARANVDNIYKLLTRNNTSSGGYAFLTIDDDETPFDAKVRFSAMPPTKKYKDISALSGGERTIASLALLFSIHSYRSPPFFVFDEIDAALDAANVEALSRYLRYKSKLFKGDVTPHFEADTPSQLLVISLKHTLFSMADQLIGVYKKDGSSQSVGFDLTQFDF
ncbi:hypothetical protein PCE1_005004 [Barthelona sp. PCE]